MNRPPTLFEEKVYEATCCIPRGKVSTYQLIGTSIGCGSSQAVGQALRRNPSAPKVPCHRVISSSLTIGGFAGERNGAEIQRKLKLLGEEGVHFDAEGRLADPSRVHSF
ncbi:MAG TPA: MGMT family protein [Verrucomicrobiaceae bacterium]|jgi:methylated-DNA-[protein]-cysteine S-methyltransferase